jgi:energy-converting hydrogenase Eha subunit C
VRTFLYSNDQLQKAMAVGLFGGTIGLLLNAVYIDVFAASKVAQTYWSISGLFLGFVYINEKTNKTERMSAYAGAETGQGEVVSSAKRSVTKRAATRAKAHK